MTQVFVKINGEVKKAEISETTHSMLRARVFLSGKPIHYFLRATAEEYGHLDENSILKYLEEHKSF